MDQNVPTHSIPQSKGLYKPLIVSVIFMATCAVALVAYHLLLVKYIRWRRQNTVLPPRTLAGTNGSGVKQELLDSIPIVIYSSKNRRALCLGEMECAVCMGELEEIDMVRVLPGCKHTFHVPCIDQWLMEHVSCPLCRLPVGASGPAMVLELPTEQGRGDDMVGEDTNSPSTTGRTRVSMIRHCASMILGRDTMEKWPLEENLKRSVSMDRLFPVAKVETTSFGLV